MEIAFSSGATAVVEAPATFELASNACRLSVGNLSAQVPPAARGFRVTTPVVQVVDLGTKFSVAAADDGKVEIHVFTGVVEYASRNAAGQFSNPLRLATGEAVQIDPQGLALPGLKADDTQFLVLGRASLGMGNQPGNGPTIFDRGFEKPFQPDDSWKQAHGGGDGTLAGSRWTIEGGAGITRNFSGFQNKGIPAREGKQHALIQQEGSLSQSISGFETGGTYTVSLLAMARQGQDFGNDLEVVLDAGQPTELILIDIPEVTASTFTVVESRPFVAEKETYELTIRSSLDDGRLDGDRTTFVDYVWFNQVATEESGQE